MCREEMAFGWMKAPEKGMGMWKLSLPSRNPIIIKKQENIFQTIPSSTQPYKLALLQGIKPGR